MSENEQNITSAPEAPQAPKAGTLKEFAKLPENKTARAQIITAAVFCFISTAVTAIVALMGTPLMLLDAAILLGLGLWLILSKSRVSAVVLMAYAAYNTVFFLIQQGTFSGWLLLLAGVLAIAGTFKLAKNWKAYQAQ